MELVSLTQGVKIFPSQESFMEADGLNPKSLL